ncbi:hypothetical protein [Sphingobium sp.]|uniref:hypothetical protein n=1 Tax=Sphingobium sp. TaxID=1912891 RepID=UPI0035C74BDD
MSVGAKLFPMALLALVVGCSPAPDGHVSARKEEPSAQVAARVPMAPPRNRSPILPETDPAARDRPASPAAAQPRDAQAAADAADAIKPGPRLLPMKPSVVNIPPPAYVPDLPPADGTADPAPFPNEVTRYMVDRDGCDHFRGEEAYDAERLAYLQENIAELCTGTDARLALLRQRYAHDPAVMSALSGYENRIEGNSSD